MLKNIIFDFGGVIGRFAPHDFVAKCVGEADHTTLYEAILANWKPLDYGEISYDEYQEKTLSLLPPRLHAAAEKYFDNWYRWIEFIPGMQTLFADLTAAGCRLYLLSNAPAIFADGFLTYGFADLFSGVIVSGAEQDRKPNMSFYETAIARFGIIPAESLFVDDLAENIEAAERVGLLGFRFLGDADGLRKHIKSLGLAV